MLGVARAPSLLFASILLLVACSSSSSSSSGDDTGRPCRQSSDCDSGRCIPRLGETVDERTLGVCTTSCGDADPCLPGWQCLATTGGGDLCQCRTSKEVCDGLDNDCNGVVDDAAGGTCTCPADKAACGEVCADLTTDRDHCGACGTVCPNGASCAGSVCTCPGTSAACGGQCVELAQDDASCGACGNACGPGSKCSQGVCRCGETGTGDACNVTVSGGEKGSFCDGASRCRSWEMVPRSLDVTSIAVGSELLFVATSSGYSSYAQSIRAYFKNGWTPAPPVVQDPIGGATSTPALAAAGLDLVYSVASDLPGPFSTGPRVVGCPGGVCGPVLAPELANALAAYDGYAYWARESTLVRCPIAACPGGPEVLGAVPAGVMRIAIDASGVYVMYRSSLGKIAPGGAFEVLGPIASADDLQLTSTRVFLKTKTGVVSCDKNGCAGGPTEILAVDPGTMTAFAADETRLYWLSAGQQLWTCTTTAAACVPSPVLAGGGGRALAQDTTRLYVVEGNDRIRVLGKL